MWENPRHCTPQSLIDPNISQCQITKTLSNSFAATVFVPTLSSGILLANSKYNHIYIYIIQESRAAKFPHWQSALFNPFWPLCELPQSHVRWVSRKAWRVLLTGGLPPLPIDFIIFHRCSAFILGSPNDPKWISTFWSTHSPPQKLPHGCRFRQTKRSGRCERVQSSNVWATISWPMCTWAFPRPRPDRTSGGSVRDTRDWQSEFQRQY